MMKWSRDSFVSLWLPPHLCCVCLSCFYPPLHPSPSKLMETRKGARTRPRPLWLIAAPPVLNLPTARGVWFRGRGWEVLGGAHKLSEFDQSAPPLPLLALLPTSCWMSPPSSAAAASAELRAVTFAGRCARSDGKRKKNRKQQNKQRAVVGYHGNLSNLVGVGSSKPLPL